jgi:hypothetical protein
MLKGYRGAGEPAAMIDERLARARLFHALILAKIVARRVPLYQKWWAAMTEQMVQRAARVLQMATSAA